MEVTYIGSSVLEYSMIQLVALYIANGSDLGHPYIQTSQLTLFGSVMQDYQAHTLGSESHTLSEKLEIKL